MKAHVLNFHDMLAAGFIWVGSIGKWYYCKRVYDDITFNLWMRNNGEWEMAVLDEMICQPYDYNYILEKWPNDTVAIEVRAAVHKIMGSLKAAGIFT